MLCHIVFCGVLSWLFILQMGANVLNLAFQYFISTWPSSSNSYLYGQLINHWKLQVCRSSVEVIPKLSSRCVQESRPLIRQVLNIVADDPPLSHTEYTVYWPSQARHSPHNVHLPWGNQQWSRYYDGCLWSDSLWLVAASHRHNVEHIINICICILYANGLPLMLCAFTW